MSDQQEKWHGFYRPSRRHRWRRLVEGDSYGDAWGALLDAAASEPPNGELLVTQSDPNGKTLRQAELLAKHAERREPA